MKVIAWTCFAIAGLLGILAVLIVMGGCALNRADGNGHGMYPWEVYGHYRPPADWTPPPPYSRGVVVKERVGFELRRNEIFQRPIILVDMEDGRNRVQVFDKATKEHLGWLPAVRTE